MSPLIAGKAPEVSGLFIYPVKSLRGVAVDTIALTQGRMAGDREYLVMNRHGQFMDQRHYPQMARVEAHVTAHGLRLRSEGFPDLEVEASAGSQRDRAIVHVLMFRRSAPVTPTNILADEWLSNVLGVSCRLMAFVPDVAALNVPHYEVHASLHDATPFHLISEESLADLNARAGIRLPVHRFRPNLVVRGASAYAEDGWKAVTIGDTMLRWVKECTRCITTTTNHITGERTGREPLATLATYRRRLPGAVTFGHYFMPERWGTELRVGDRVTPLA